MPRQIQDQFTNMDISRQRRYQLRREAEGCCRICGKAGAPYCPDHRLEMNDLARLAREKKRTAAYDGV